MWLQHREVTEGVKKLHGRNGRELSLPYLPLSSVDGYFLEGLIIHEYFCCYYHAHTCQPFREVSTLSGDTLPERYERKLSRLEQIMPAR